LQKPIDNRLRRTKQKFEKEKEIGGSTRGGSDQQRLAQRGAVSNQGGKHGSAFCGTRIPGEGHMVRRLGKKVKELGNCGMGGKNLRMKATHRTKGGEGLRKKEERQMAWRIWGKGVGYVSEVEAIKGARLVQSIRSSLNKKTRRKIERKAGKEWGARRGEKGWSKEVPS